MNACLLGVLGACAITTFVSLPAQAVGVSGQGTWESTLQGRDLDGNAATYEAYYDTALNITWLANANAAGTGMTWADAKTWANNLNVNGVTGWRLPTLSPIDGTAFNFTYGYDGTTDTSYSVSAPGTTYAGSTASEMAYLYYNTLGNLARLDTSGTVRPGWGLTNNTGPFSNFESDSVFPSGSYWTGLDCAVYACAFSFYNGFQGYEYQTSTLFALAVRPGDISAVPVPAAMWLFGSGLMGLLGMAKRKR